MNELELTESEKTVLSEASANLTRTQHQAAEASRLAMMAQGAIQQAFRTILMLRGANPDAYQLSVSPDGQFRVVPIET